MKRAQSMGFVGFLLLATACHTSDAMLGGDSASDADSAACMISASNYDQSCAVDTDCTEVSSGDYCGPGGGCPLSAINVGAFAKFSADVAKTPLGSGALGNGTGFGCQLADFPPCCRRGICQSGLLGACMSLSDTLPACADAGGICYPANAIVSCSSGPPDACAYSDELCCLH